jgi:hypothetical protein
MGRCYEFGVLVGEGCQHAMVVPASGGRCECEACGVACTGKFAACASILAQPGYVPATAPAWALQKGEGTAATGAGSRSLGSGTASASGPEVAAAVDGLAARLDERLAELTRRIDALAADVTRLQHPVDQQAAALEAAVAALDEAVKRLDEGGRPAPLFGFPRRQP